MMTLPRDRWFQFCLLEKSLIDGAADVLNLGCGPTRVEGAVNLDMYGGDGVLKADARAMSVFEDGKFDLILAHQLLEHFSPEDARKALAEWYRITKSGGRLVVSTPDFDGIVEVYADAGKDAAIYAVDSMIFGVRDQEGMEHKSIYNEYLLQERVRGAGFRIEKTEINYPPAYTPTVTVIGRKP